MVHIVLSNNITHIVHIFFYIAIYFYWTCNIISYDDICRQHETYKNWSSAVRITHAFYLHFEFYVKTHTIFLVYCDLSSSLTKNVSWYFIILCPSIHSYIFYIHLSCAGWSLSRCKRQGRSPVNHRTKTRHQTSAFHTQRQEGHVHNTTQKGI